MCVIAAKARSILAQLERLAQITDEPRAGPANATDELMILRLAADDFAATLPERVLPIAVTRALTRLGRTYPTAAAAVPLDRLHNFFLKVYVKPRVKASIETGTVTIDGVSISGVAPKLCELVGLLWRHAPRPVKQETLRSEIRGLLGDKTILRLRKGDSVPWQVRWLIKSVEGRGNGLAIRLPDESVYDLLMRDDPPEIDPV